jgi:2-polyprenyl-3-methyl-5-hydroxy-6-metoxy-1,4-benzoquinol methylase
MRVSPDIDFPVALQPCAFCGGLKFETLARQDRHLLRLRTVGCSQCGLVQTNPRPDAEGLSAFYMHHYRKLYQGVTDPSLVYVSQYRKDERLRYTVQHLQAKLDLHPGSTLLDYGCGEGSLFAALRNAGFRGRLVGVEPNARFARYAEQAGDAEVHTDATLLRGLDAVVINHVLEHLADPVGVLRDLGARLKPGGWLYLDVPDASRYTHVGDLHLAHILHFTQATLQAVVQHAGFVVVNCEAHDPPHHPRSVRLRAHPGQAGREPSTVCSASGEARTWQLLRQMDACSWRWTWSQRLARLGPVNTAYRTLRRWTTPAAKP